MEEETRPEEQDQERIAQQQIAVKENRAGQFCLIGDVRHAVIVREFRVNHIDSHTHRIQTWTAQVDHRKMPYV